MVLHWLRGNQIKMRYIDPGSPWQNGYSERFDSRFRDGCVNRECVVSTLKCTFSVYGLSC